MTDPQLLWRAQQTRQLITRHGRLDLLNIEHLAGAPRSYELLRAGAVRADLGGHTVAFAGLDDLIRMKRAAGRDQDLADIGALHARRPATRRRGVPVNIGRRWTSTCSFSEPQARPRARGVAARHAGAPGRRPAADRLRRGHAAAAHALCRAGRARGAVHHPLPRRSRARAAGDAEDLRAAPARASADGVRAARPRTPVPDPRARDRPADVPLELEELEPNDQLERDGYRIAAFGVDHGGGGARLRAGRGAAPGRVRPRAGARAGRHARPRLRPPPGRRGGRRRASRAGDGERRAPGARASSRAIPRPAT